MKKKILIGVVLLIIVLQFFGIDKTNPVSDPSQDFFAGESADTALKNKIKAACYDCHSNETQYPWYANIVPVSWWLRGHIKNGREHLNFSIWNSYEADKKKHKLEECAEEVREGKMPLNSYTWTHPEAKMSDQEIDDMATYFAKRMTEVK